MPTPPSKFGFSVSAKIELAALCFVYHQPTKDVRDSSGLVTAIVRNGCQERYGVTTKTSTAWSGAIADLVKLGYLVTEVKGRRRPYVGIGEIPDKLLDEMGIFHKTHFIVKRPLQPNRIEAVVEPPPKVEAAAPSEEIDYDVLAVNLLSKVMQVLSREVSGEMSDTERTELLQSIDRYRRVADERQRKIRRLEGEIEVLAERNQREQALRKKALEHCRALEGNVRRLAENKYIFDDKASRELRKLLGETPRNKG